MTAARYTVLMMNPAAGVAAEHPADLRRPAEVVAHRANRRDDVLAGVIGHLGGPEADR